VNLFDTKDKLTDGQLSKLANHPVKAIEVVTKYGDSLSQEVRMVVYQIHERCDGSGYPRGFHAEQIHPLAKIAAVADAFVGMVSPRKHRYAIQGFSANLALMEDAKNGKYDPRVIRALLHSTSLHPIGSRVELSNGRVGQIVRSGGANYVSPTIRMWSPNRMEAEPTIIDLAMERSLRITRSLPAAA
jgi:HD-GYP domain-containing protein (c-di-GMP phosphodiesterase class II)